jgi:hypothetical protein
MGASNLSFENNLSVNGAIAKKGCIDTKVSRLRACLFELQLFKKLLHKNLLPKKAVVGRLTT